MIHIRRCGCCDSEIEIAVHDEQTIDFRMTKLDPLVKEREAIVGRYASIKGLGEAWRRDHKARGMLVAGDIVNSLGAMPGRVDVALELIGWMEGGAKLEKWDLEDARRLLPTFLSWRQQQLNPKKSVCDNCGERFSGTGKYCPRHDFLAGEK